MIYYLIFAQICLAVRTPNWVVILCYVMFGLKMIVNIAQSLIKTIKEKKRKEEK